MANPPLGGFLLCATWSFDCWMAKVLVKLRKSSPRVFILCADDFRPPPTLPPTQVVMCVKSGQSISFIAV